LAYISGRFHLPHKIKWDELATELLGPDAESVDLKDEFERLLRKGRF
jgi:hypothetical protein